MDVWGPARVRGQGHERYFLLVVDDYSRYTTVFPLRTKGEVTEVLIDWIRAARLRLRDSFGSDFPVLRLHSDRGGEFSSALLGAFCRAQGIRQTFTLPASPQQNGIAERRIGMVMDVARTSMINAAAPHFLWPFAVQYAAHQLNLQPRVSLPETSPTLRWTGKVGDASAFRVWGSRAFVRDLSADNLSPRAVPCVFLGFPTGAPGWRFYHPTSCRVLSSQDVTFDGSVPYYRLFPYRTASLPPPPLFLAPGPPPVDPLPPQGPAPSGVSQVDAVEPVEVAVDSGAARSAEPAGAGSGGAGSGGAETRGAEPGGAETRGAGSGGAETGGHADASWADDQATQRSSQGYTFSLGSGSVSWRSTRSSSVLSSSCEAEIYAGAMAAQELLWLTYLLIDLGEQPRSPPVLYVDNKAMLALCREHRLEHRTKHIALRYFLARELQQRGFPTCPSRTALGTPATRQHGNNKRSIFLPFVIPCSSSPPLSLLSLKIGAGGEAAVGMAEIVARVAGEAGGGGARDCVRASALLLGPMLLPDGTGGGVAAIAASATAATALPLFDMLQLFLWVAVSPAVAEELLFRGLLLTALQERLGRRLGSSSPYGNPFLSSLSLRIDAAMLSAALFALFHLSLSLLFPSMALGIAAGLLAVYSNSVLPAVALHATSNASAHLYALMATGCEEEEAAVALIAQVLMEKYGPQIVREGVEAGNRGNEGGEEVEGEEQAAAQEERDGIDKEVKEEEADAEASEDGSPGTASHRARATTLSSLLSLYRFFSFGISSPSTVVSLLASNPQLLRSNPTNDFLPLSLPQLQNTLEFLLAQGVRQRRLGSVLRCVRNILRWEAHSTNLDVLVERAGVPMDKLGGSIEKYPSILTRNKEALITQLETLSAYLEAKERLDEPHLDTPHLSRLIVSCPSIFSTPPYRIAENFAILQSFTPPDTPSVSISVLRRAPSLLGYSKETLLAKLQFFVDLVGEEATGRVARSHLVVLQLSKENKQGKVAVLADLIGQENAVRVVARFPLLLSSRPVEGPALWALLFALISLKGAGGEATGGLSELAAAAAAARAVGGGGGDSLSATGLLLGPLLLPDGTGGGAAATAAYATAASAIAVAAISLLDVLQLFLWVAAVAEELLFRGLLLMAGERLGRRLGSELFSSSFQSPYTLPSMQQQSFVFSYPCFPW
ncbi:unnamed protein product [Closterium sp. NIES-54]